MPAPTSTTRLAGVAVPDAGQPAGVDQQVEPGRWSAPVELGRRAARNHRQVVRGGQPPCTAAAASTVPGAATQRAGTPATSSAGPGLPGERRAADRRQPPLHVGAPRQSSWSQSYTCSNDPQRPRATAPGSVTSVTDETKAPVAKRVHARAHPPRRHGRRRVRLARRQGRSRHDRLPRGGERVHRGARPRTSPPLRETLFDEIKTPHPGDRPLGADPQGRLLVLHPHRRGPAVRHPLPASPSRPGETAPPATGDGAPLAGEESCSTATRSPTGTSSSRSARSTSARTAAGWPTRPTSPATSASPCGSRTCAPARCSPTRCRTRSTARPGRPTASTLFYLTVDDAWRPYRVWRHTRRHARRRRRDRLRGARRAVLGRRRAHPLGAVHPHRVPAARSPARYGSSRPTTRPPTPARDRAAPAGRRVLGRAPRPPVPDPAQRRRRGLRARVHVGRRPGRLDDADRAPARHPAGVGRRVRRAPGRLAAPRRPDRPAGAAARRRPTATTSSSPSRSTASAWTPTRSTTPTIVRLRYTSLVTPDSVYDYDLVTGELMLRKQQAGARRTGLRPGRLRAAPRVGAGRRRHPRADLAGLPQGHAARRLGARACSTATARTRHRWTRGSRSPRLSLLDRGFVFAVAHVRGGGEMGRRWYDDGKLLAKKNTFTDFVACARAPGRRPAGPRRTGWSPAAARPAAC